MLCFAWAGSVSSPCASTDIRELELLVRSPKTRSVMFVITHNNESRSIARGYQACHEAWVRIADLPTTVFFESYLYKAFLPQHFHELTAYDYVITVTYKTLSRHLLPRYMPVLSFNGIKRMLKVARSGEYDVLPFMRDFEEMMTTSVKYHTEHFRTAWDSLLMELGFNRTVIERLYPMKAFYRNVFIIKPSILAQLTVFMNKAIDVAETNPRIKAMLQKNAKYTLGTPQVAHKVFGTSYYQLYPFVFERLPAFYLNAIGAKICTGPDTPCKYNYKG